VLKLSKSSHNAALKKGQVINMKDTKEVKTEGGIKMAMDVGSFIEKARKELSSLIGLPISSTTGIRRDEKGWHISIEIVEKKSIPDQMDILALYEVLYGEDGNLLSFERKSMRKRMESVSISE
jgi:hypothetical protein